jgi:hypothetical protein
LTASLPPAEEPQPSATPRRRPFWGRFRRVPSGNRSRLFSILAVAALIVIVASTVTQAWFVFVVLPQQIRSSEPVVIDQANLLSNGPYVGCFVLLSGEGGVAHQGEDFALSWNVVAPSNASPSCTVQSIDWVIGPGNGPNVSGSNLPVTVLAGHVGVVQVFFAPLNYPFWGSVTVVVTETNP